MSFTGSRYLASMVLSRVNFDAFLCKNGDEPRGSLVKASSFDLSVPKVGAEADPLGFLLRGRLAHQAT